MGREKWVTGGNDGSSRDLLPCLNELDIFLGLQVWALHREVWDVFPFHVRSMAECPFWRVPGLPLPPLALMSQPHSVGLYGPRVVLKPMFEELRSRVCPPFRGRGSQAAADKHSPLGLSTSTMLAVWGRHQGLIGRAGHPLPVLAHKSELQAYHLGTFAYCLPRITTFLREGK